MVDRWLGLLERLVQCQVPTPPLHHCQTHHLHSLTKGGRKRGRGGRERGGEGGRGGGRGGREREREWWMESKERE